MCDRWSEFSLLFFCLSLCSSCEGFIHCVHDSFSSRVSLNDLQIVLPSSAADIDPSEYLDVLNGSLVYLCHKHADNNIIDCYGIGT